MTRFANSSYECVAAEYYDARRHPTCHNFNRLSRIYIERHFTAALASKHVLEIGAGESSVAPLMAANKWDLRHLTISDVSPTMLNRSAKWRNEGARLVVGDAEALADWGPQTDVIVAGLGDPYNTAKFWLQASDCLRVDGRVIFTLPSFEWAARFRPQGSDRLVAEFVIATGETVKLPSFVPPLDCLVEMIESAGLVVVNFEALGVEQLGCDPVSSKISQTAADKSIVWGVVAMRLSDSISRRGARHSGLSACLQMLPGDVS